MSSDVNVTIVGYGLAGSVFHAPLVAATAGLRLHSIVSRDPAKVARDFPDVAVLPSIEAACAAPEVDLVVVATPDAFHGPHARAAIDAGKHIVIDKPFALSWQEARGIADRAAARGRILSVFHNRRWDGDFLTTRRLIADGVLGEILHFESHFDRFRPVVRDRWREQPGAGIWRDLGPHLVDQALQLFGIPDGIYADLAEQRQGARTTDYFHVLLGYGRLRVILHASQMMPASDLRFAVHGSRGSFIKHGLDGQEEALKGGVRPGGVGWGADPRPGTLTLAGEDGAVRQAAFASLAGDYPAYYAALRDCIREGAPNPVPPDQALAVMQVLDAGLTSAERACLVPIGPGG